MGAEYVFMNENLCFSYTLMSEMYKDREDISWLDIGVLSHMYMNIEKEKKKITVDS